MTHDTMVMLTTPEQIAGFRMLTLLAGLKLEVLGMRKSGRSCYQIIKQEFGLKGTRRQVLDAYQELLYKRGLKQRPQ
jgi:hypothetical protein